MRSSRRFTVWLPFLFTAFSAGSSWGIRFTMPGGVAAWGDNSYGQLNRPVSLTNIMAAVAGEFHNLALSEDGTVTAWGDNTFGRATVPSGLSNVTAVAAGEFHNLALKGDGTVIGWGANMYGQTNIPAGLSNVVAIAAGGYVSTVLRADGTVVQWGHTNSPLPPSLQPASAISVGYRHSLALQTDGTVAAWGNGDNYQTRVPNGLADVVAIAAGGWHSMALKSDGTVVAWGRSLEGQIFVPSGLSNVMAIAAGQYHSMALKNDGTVVCWGDNTYGQTNAPALPTVKSISAGYYHSLAEMFSPLVQYSVNVTNDLLLVCNTNSVNSLIVKDYYLAHRPMVAGANVLGIGCNTNEVIDLMAFTNTVAAPMLRWFTNNPTKHPQYIILFPDIPSRVWSSTNTNAVAVSSVAYGLATNSSGILPFVTTISMGFSNLTNDCIAYINKLETFGTNYSPGKLIISASIGGYPNTNYLLDNIRHGTGYGPGKPDLDYSGSGYVVSTATNALLAAGVPANAIHFFDGLETLTNGVAYNLVRPGMATNVGGYMCWGAHSSLMNEYPRNANVVWNGQSSWWVIETVESFNGQRDTGQGNFTQWFSQIAFGGTNYENTPVAAITHTDEPGLHNVNDSPTYF